MSSSSQLLARARSILSAGPAQGEVLARQLYGVIGPVGPWVPVLERELRRSGEFMQLPDGAWSVHPTAPPGRLGVVARVTRARGGRLLALAVAPLDTLHPVWRWRFRTDQRAGSAVRRSSLLDEDTALELAEFSDVAEEVLEVLRNCELVVSDRRYVEWLNRELALFSRASLDNPVHVASSSVWTGGNRKASLAQVRERLGLTPHVHDELWGELELLCALARHGDESRGAEPELDARVRSSLRAQADALPSAPGVYVFRGGEDECLYVGSASDLRRRALSYFGEQIDLTRGLRGLLERASAIRFERTGTHVEALLLEAERIAEWEPLYNVQRSVHGGLAWLRIGAEPPVGVVQVARAPRADGASYLGPVPDHASLRALSLVLSALWGLRQRGASAKTDASSLRARDELTALLLDPESFVAEARRRFHRSEPRLSVHRRTELQAALARVERLAMSGELQVGAVAPPSALVSRYDPERERLYLLLVKAGAPVVCSRVPADDEALLREAVEVMLDLELAEPDDPAGQQALVRRWLHARRQDPWVFQLEPGADVEAIVARALAAVDAARQETRAPEAQRYEDDWEW
ncbi:MAG: hypothetical protein M3281_02565 [Chloroflexota bacterium]|nr:hypothetical protein [Chloroflexota bacterium]